jgi:antitoxin VapB
MAFSRKDKETDRLARTPASLTGEPLTNAIPPALAERLEPEHTRRGQRLNLADIHALATACAGLPEVDTRSAEDMAGYDEHGM